MIEEKKLGQMLYIEFYNLKKKEDQILERTDGRMFGMKWVLKCS